MTVKPHSRQVFGMSDSASLFVPEGKKPSLGEKMVELSAKNRPAICYIGAARGDKLERIQEFVQLAERIGADSRILSLFDPFTDDADTFFKDIDIIFIDGGSTRNLLALFREWGVIEPLRAAYNNGVILAGASAGLNILFDWSITDSIKSDIRPVEGLGILEGSVCVHHDAHPKRPEIFEKFLKSGTDAFPGYSLDDGVAVHFENEQITDIFTVSPEAGLICHSKAEGQIIRTPMRATALNSK